MKIPKQAKKVFTGDIFDVYQWPQKMFDGSIKTFEMIKRPYSTRIIATEGQKIFICTEKQPGTKKVVGNFGGRVDKGETPLQAAKRELLEESGLKSNDWELFDRCEFYPEKMDFSIFTYIARDCKKIKNPTKDPGEDIKISKVNFAEFIKIALDKKSPMTKDFIAYILRLKLEGKLDEFKQKLFKKIK